MFCDAKCVVFKEEREGLDVLSDLQTSRVLAACPSTYVRTWKLLSHSPCSATRVAATFQGLARTKVRVMKVDVEYIPNSPLDRHAV